MSQPFSRLLHPFEVAPHPGFEPEVERAILASWASGRDTIKDSLRRRQRAKRPASGDEGRNGR